MFQAKAVVLATGGIGRAFKITSNSWEYTGDGHALAYDAGAELHGHGVRPVPPDRHGLAAAACAASSSPKACAAKAASCRTSDGKRFMFDDIPDNYRAQTADNEEEGWRYTQGDKNARRPPELLTRDHVARCIMREVQGGPRQPARRRVPRHRLDQGAASRTRAEHIKKKLPSMYHQFKQLADLDITKEPMEVGPTTHYIMGGIRVDGDTQMSTRAGPVRRGRVRRRASTAPIGSAATRSPTSRVRQARRRVRGEVRARSNGAGAIDDGAGRRGRDDGRSRRSSAARSGEGPYQVQYDLQEMMQDLVGIVRNEAEMQQALDGIEELQARARDASASAATASTTPAGTPRSTCATC